VFDRLFDALGELGCTFPERRAVVHASVPRATLAARLRVRLNAALPQVAVEQKPLESSYYLGVRVLLGAVAANGERGEIADVGVFDWVAQLTANRRMRMVASGFGLQRALLTFRRQ
jgi:hypothetical protein